MWVSWGRTSVDMDGVQVGIRRGVRVLPSHAVRQVVGAEPEGGGIWRNPRAGLWPGTET
jgi:hypothetical protein